MSRVSRSVYGDPRASGDLDCAAIGRYVLGRRTSEGGYCFYRTPEWGVEEPNAPDTVAALKSLRIIGFDIPAPRRTSRWLCSLQDDDGGYPTLTIGSAALRALDVLTVEPKLSPDRWLRGRLEAFCGCDRPRDWRAAIIDALRLCELMHLRHGVFAGWERDSMTALLDAARAPDGGWARPGADLETTAIAVRLAQLVESRWAPRSAACDLLASLREPGARPTARPNAEATSVGALWGGLALGRVLGQRLRYLDAVGQQLALLQRPDGGLGARHRAISTLQATWLGLEAANLLNRLREEQT